MADVVEKENMLIIAEDDWKLVLLYHPETDGLGVAVGTKRTPLATYITDFTIVADWMARQKTSGVFTEEVDLTKSDYSDYEVEEKPLELYKDLTCPSCGTFSHFRLVHSQDGEIWKPSNCPKCGYDWNGVWGDIGEEA